jgi:hypothetical protein
MRSKLQLVAAAAVATTLAGAAPAEAGAGSEYALRLSSPRPGTAAELTLSVTYRRPGDPAAKPPPLESVAFDLPDGLRLDTAATPSCEATNEQLRLQGRSACPPASRVGSGTLIATTGFPGIDPVETDVTVFNGGDELIELVSFKGTDQTAGYDRLTIEGTRLTAHPPFVPGGPPDGRTTVRSIDLTIGTLPTTPPVCPASGAWLSRASFKFVSYEPEQLVAETPCEAERGNRRAPRMTLSVSPGRVPAGRRTRLRIRVRSDAPACRRRVAIRLGGRRTRTDSRGRATLTVRLRKRGRRSVRARKPGCTATRAWVRSR